MTQPYSLLCWSRWGRRELNGFIAVSVLYACAMCMRQQRTLRLPQQVPLRVKTLQHLCTQIPTVEYGHLQHVSKNRSYENVSNVLSQNLIVQSYFSSIKCSVIFLNWSTTLLAYLSSFNLNHS